MSILLAGRGRPEDADDVNHQLENRSPLRAISMLSVLEAGNVSFRPAFESVDITQGSTPRIAFAKAMRARKLLTASTTSRGLRVQAAAIPDLPELDMPAGSTSTEPARGSRQGSRLLRRSGGFAQLARFILAGTLSNTLYVLAFLTLAAYGSLVANAVGAVLSTMVANELHRRLTFRAADRVRWFVAQWEGGALALVGMTLSSLTLAVLHWALPNVDRVVEVTLIVAVSAVIGGLRFLALRGWVFA